MDTVARALAVMVLDPKIRAFLEVNDPKALEQAKKALKKAGHSFPYPPATLAWCRGEPIPPALGRPHLSKKGWILWEDKCEVRILCWMPPPEGRCPLNWHGWYEVGQVPNPPPLDPTNLTLVLS